MVGTMIMMAYAGVTTAGALTGFQMAMAFAINFAVSNIVTRAFAPDASSNQSVDNGVRQQVPPSSTNSIPIVYGDAYMGGAFVDAVLSNDAKTMYYVLAISHISPNGQFSFDLDNMYWGDRKIVFDSVNKTKVVGLIDGAGNEDTKPSGNIYIGLYTSTQSGVISSSNGAALPSAFMGGEDIPYELRWPSSGRQMNGLAFAIVKMNYNREAETTSMQTLTYHVSHYLNDAGCAKPGDVWYDYMTNEQYGAAMASDLVSLESAQTLNDYSDGLIPYTNDGVVYYQPRYRINGVIDTGQSCLNNINSIMTVCDSWNQYNAAKGQWSVVINKAETTAYAFNDSNIIGEIRVSAFDITSSINQIEAEFPSKENRDQSDFVYYETPTGLLYPNEPSNKQSVQFSMTNDSVQAQYLATRLLEQAREDLIVNFSTTYNGIQVDAGDVVSVTNSSYGWTNKLFRVMRVSEASLPDGTLGANLELNEYNSQVYDNKDITKYKPAPNTGLPDPSYFGVVPAPTVSSSYPSAAVPNFNVQPYMSAASFASYAEIWYSAFPTPAADQLYFGGTTALPSNGVPYVVGQALPKVNLTTLPAGDWYLFARIVNPAATSKYSVASSVFKWRPTTFQYTERYICVAYADSITGTGFSFNPRNKSYYGLVNITSANPVSNPSDFTWYEAPIGFATQNYLLYSNRSNRKFSFDVGNAAYANLTGAFVPTENSKYDNSIWAALEDGLNIIDLDKRTGQLTKVGTTSVSSADGLLSVSNNINGSMVVSLEKFLNFGSGVYSKTFNAATLTVDIYGRVVGFTQPDAFYFTELIYSASAGQTSFAVNHTIGDVIVWRNGSMCSLSDYTETTTTVVLNNACVAGELITIFNMRAVSTDEYYENMRTFVSSVGVDSIVYSVYPYQLIEVGDKLTFANSGTPTQYTVQSVDIPTKTVTFTTSLSGVVVDDPVYRYRGVGQQYRPFSRVEADLISASEYSATGISITNGFELLSVNGAQFNEIDYDLTGSVVGGFPSALTGKIVAIQFSENNFGVPACNTTNTVAYSIDGALSYTLPNNPLSFALYANGALLAKGTGYDYTATNAGYNLTNAFNNNFTLLNQQTYARDGAA